MASSGTQVGCLVSSLVFFLVYTPLTIFFLTKLLRIRFHPVFKARLMHITIIIIVSVILHLIIAGIYLLELGDYIPINLEMIQYAPYCILSYGLLLRFWLYHYKIQFEDLTANQEWKSIIDGHMEQEMKEDWFLVNKKTYGSWKWLIKRFCVLPFLAGVLFPILIHTVPPNGAGAWVYIVCVICEMILAFFPAGAIAWIVARELDEFNDVLYVLDEMAKLKWR